MAASAREHNHANVLALGARWLAPGQAEAMLRTFLGTPGAGDRHARRVALIAAIEQRYSRHGRRR
jgi:ribose 5-phosphate isomerase B